MWFCKKCSGEIEVNVETIIDRRFLIDKDGFYNTNSTYRDVGISTGLEYHICKECGSRTDEKKSLQDIGVFI